MDKFEVGRSNPPVFLPIQEELINAGFPSPADDHIENSIDLNEYLIKHPCSTFFLRVSGHSMNDAGIKDGDLLIVDRNINASPNDVVVAMLDGEFILKKLIKKDGEIYLKSEKSNYPIFPINKYLEVQIWGVATYVIHKLIP